VALGVIAVDDRTFVHYAHLQRNSVAMKTGQVVRRGQVIGRLGNSGIRTQHIFISTSLMVPHPKLHKGCLRQSRGGSGSGVDDPHYQPVVEVVIFKPLGNADPNLNWRSSTRTAEKQDVAISVLEFESTQTIIGIFEWLGELDIARREFSCQRVRIGDIEVRVPARPGFSFGVRKRIDTDVLEHDHRGAPLDNAEEDVVRGPLKRYVEPETVAIKRQRGGDILDDEEWRNAGNFWFGHVSLHRRFSRTFTTGLLWSQG